VKQVAVIGATGAIGQAFVRHYADLPGVETVWALSRRQAASDGKIRPLVLDLAEEATIRNAAAAIEGPLDMIIVATGLLHAETPLLVSPEKSLTQLDPAVLQRLFQVNSIGPAMIMKHFLPLLRRDSRSVFAALSARVGSITDNQLGGWYGYRASKAALNMLVKTAAIEIRRSNKQAIVVGLHPGTVDSALSLPFQQRVPPAQLFSPTLAVSKLARVLDNLDTPHSGKCFAHDGSEIPA
jgi:NAD(P)-dependent dehydrogenase (short-subunit alcohol dehydrogenase family)